jgi:hypothetical protein
VKTKNGDKINYFVVNKECLKRHKELLLQSRMGALKWKNKRVKCRLEWLEDIAKQSFKKSWIYDEIKGSIICNGYCPSYKEEQLEIRVHHVLMKYRKPLQVAYA